MTFTQIITDARRLVKATSVTYPTSEITESANNALERAVNIIRESQGRWQWDDSNNSDFPFATTTLTTDQQDYSLDETHYRIERVEVKDEDAAWTKLIPIDQADLFDQDLTSFMSGSGVPKYYDKVGNSLYLYPKPSYTQAASLKVYYERGADYFLTTDTSKTPGFNPLFHRLVSLYAALDYATINQLPVADDLEGKIAVMEEDMRTYYSLRDVDDRVRLQARPHNFK